MHTQPPIHQCTCKLALVHTHYMHNPFEHTPTHSTSKHTCTHIHTHTLPCLVHNAHMCTCKHVCPSQARAHKHTNTYTQAHAHRCTCISSCHLQLRAEPTMLAGRWEVVGPLGGSEVTGTVPLKGWCQEVGIGTPVPLAFLCPQNATR
jgi:hypothetical protein